MSADPNLTRFRQVVEGALVHLESRRDEVNALNVFPVADGDTGDNLALTLQAVLVEIDRLASDGTRSIDTIGREEIVAAVSRSSLLGARGNSGVILSQLIRGAAEELLSRPGELVDGPLIAAAIAQAAQRAYASVSMPVEGTMLTVMRDMAAAIAHDLAHAGADRPAITPASSPSEQNEVLAAALERAIAAGEESVRRGPELLPALREAGVVDAGGYAVTIMFAGVVAALRGGVAPELAHYIAPRVEMLGADVVHESTTFRYCLTFAVTGRSLPGPEHWRPLLEPLGDSMHVVGDEQTLKVHIHTDDPERAQALFGTVGTVSHVVIGDMITQVAERRRSLDRQARTAILAVASGEGIRDLFAQVGALTVDGGPTMNPSTRDLVAAIEATGTDEVVLLPNSPNVVMAAERAAEMVDRPVVVVPTRSQQAGLIAAVAGRPQDGAEENAAALRAALTVIRTGGVAPAARKDPGGRFAIGDAVGYVDEQLVAWGDPDTTLRSVVGALSGDAELLTMIEADDVPLDRDSVAALVPEAVEVELSHGGQPSWWWLLAAE